MSEWRTGTPADAERLGVGAPTAIAEVHIFMYGMEPGNAEVQVKFTDDAKPGAPRASTAQEQFKAAAIRELRSALDTLTSP